MIRFNKRVLGARTGVHCKTEKEAISLLTWANSLGYTWVDCKPFIPIDKQSLQVYNENTVYNITQGQYYSVISSSNSNITTLPYEEVVIDKPKWLV